MRGCSSNSSRPCSTEAARSYRGRRLASIVLARLGATIELLALEIGALGAIEIAQELLRIRARNRRGPANLAADLVQHLAVQLFAILERPAPQQLLQHLELESAISLQLAFGEDEACLVLGQIVRQDAARQRDDHGARNQIPGPQTLAIEEWQQDEEQHPEPEAEPEPGRAPRGTRRQKADGKEVLDLSGQVTRDHRARQQRSAASIDYADAHQPLARCRPAPEELEMDHVEIADQEGQEDSEREGQHKAGSEMPEDEKHRDDDEEGRNRPEQGVEDEGGQAVAIARHLHCERHAFRAEDMLLPAPRALQQQGGSASGRAGGGAGGRGHASVFLPASRK